MINGKIGDFFEVKGGKRLPKGCTFSNEVTPYPYLRVTDFKKNSFDSSKIKYIDPDVQAQIRNYTIDAGSVYISIAGTIGVAGIVPESFDGANLTENAAKFVPVSECQVDSQYFSYYLNSKKIQNIIKSKTMAVGVPKLALFRIKEIPISLPLLADQQKIVAILNAVDKLRQKDQQLIDHYTALSQSLFIEMFGDPVSNSKGWAQCSLADVSQKITDGTHKTPKYVEDGVLFLSAKNIKKNRIVLHSVKYITQVEHDILSKRCDVELGDILITKSGSIGMAGIVDINETFSIFESLALIKYNRTEIDGVFLLYFLNTPSTQYQYRRSTKGVGVKHLHLTDLRKIIIILPPRELQVLFTDHVGKIDKQKQQAVSSLKKSEILFESLLQSAFNGELTTGRDE